MLATTPTIETLAITDFIQRPEITMKTFHNPLKDEFPSVFPGIERALAWWVDRSYAIPPLVPRLTRLTLTIGNFNHDDALVDMIESRSRSSPSQDPPEVAKLKFVCLKFRLRSMENSAWKRIRNFEGKDGFEIRVLEL